MSTATAARVRNDKIAFVKAWQASGGPNAKGVDEADPQAVADALGVTRQTVKQRESALRRDGVNLKPAARKESERNAVSLDDLNALCAAPAAPADQSTQAQA